MSWWTYINGTITVEPMGRTQAEKRYILETAVNGAFRDREFYETFREFMKWICRLAKRVSINSILVKIKGYDKEYVINDSCDYDSPYSQMEEYPSWCEESNGEPCWAEHLMCDKAKDSDYPMLLAYKYFADPENDAEVERRREFQKK